MIEKKLDRALRDFIWHIVDIHAQLEEIHKAWAELLGISEPQWLILMAIDELDSGNGVSGVDVSNKLRIHPAFVTNQTKSLEKAGLLAREPSPDDGRFVLMSLTAKARSDIAKLSKKRQALSATIIGSLDERSLNDLNAKLGTITKNARIASQKLAIDMLSS
jgi:MarR family transcriptional regulator, organic hydroperoxide resistance regulator